MAVQLAANNNPSYNFTVEMPRTTSVDGKLITTVEKTRLILTKTQIESWICRSQDAAKNEELEAKAERHFAISLGLTILVLALLITSIFLNYYIPY
jgi:hypothetical protein